MQCRLATGFGHDLHEEVQKRVLTRGDLNSVTSSDAATGKGVSEVDAYVQGSESVRSSTGASLTRHMLQHRNTPLIKPLRSASVMHEWKTSRSVAERRQVLRFASVDGGSCL